jgi:hypothetical protein
MYQYTSDSARAPLLTFYRTDPGILAAHVRPVMERFLMILDLDRQRKANRGHPEGTCNCGRTPG